MSAREVVGQHATESERRPRSAFSNDRISGRALARYRQWCGQARDLEAYGGLLGRAGRRPYVPCDHRGRRRVNVVEVFPGGLACRRMAGSPGIVGGGLRGAIAGFSMDSRRRLRRELLELDWAAVAVSHVVLTYHHDWGDWRAWKRDLWAFERRFFRAWGHLAYGFIWRLEFQGRGAPHFHLAPLWKKGRRPPEPVFAAWCRQAWCQVIGAEDDVDARRYAAKVRHLVARGGDLGRLLGYLVNEVGKVSQGRLVDTETGELQATGRVWGVVGNVPRAVAELYKLTEAAWAEFLARVNAAGREVKSWYMSNVSPLWAGFNLLGSPAQLRPLLEGLPGFV